MKKDGGGRKKEERGRIKGKKDMGKENEVRVRNKAEEIRRKEDEVMRNVTGVRGKTKQESLLHIHSGNYTNSLSSSQ